MIVAFDFDGTLTRQDARGRFTGFRRRSINLLRLHAHRGDLVLIVTARDNGAQDARLSDEGQTMIRGYPLIHATAHRFRLPVEAIVFTDRQLKGPTLEHLEVDLLYDDMPEQRASALDHGVRARDLR